MALYSDLEKASLTDRYLDVLKRKGVPEFMAKDIARYVLTGNLQGGFLRALFANDLIGAFMAADGNNTKLMPVYVDLLYCELPADCSGSAEAVNKWIQQGGILMERRLAS